MEEVSGEGFRVLLLFLWFADLNFVLLIKSSNFCFWFKGLGSLTNDSGSNMCMLWQ